MDFFKFQYDPAVKFDMYTPMHGLMLLIFVILVVLFFMFKHKIYTSKHEKQIRYGYGIFLILMHIVLIVVEYGGGHVYLPFHLCSISFVLTYVLLFTNNEKIFQFLMYTGIIGGLVSFAIPDLYHAGYNRFKFYEFIIAHTSIILVPIYYFSEYRFKLDIKSLYFTIIITNILGFVMLPINILLDRTGIIEGANFMFTLGPPEDVEAVFGTFPFHLLVFEMVLLVSFFGVYKIANYTLHNMTKKAT